MAIVSVVLMLVVPLPAVVLDLLLAINITGSLLILLMSLFVRRPLDFAIFPALLLVATMFRLALNVSSTRLVLLDGYAGKVIEAFGHFVIGGSLVVGMVVFLILVVIQFMVITAGATRVAEVGARFTLDAMPGKQMAIDADLNSGLIDEDTARRRRADVAAEADFYGAMDGASKFVKGDAMAGIVITIINLFGGFAHRRRAARHADVGRRQHLQPAHRRRRPGLADPGAAHLGRQRPDRHPVGHRRRHGLRHHRPVQPAAARRAHRRRGRRRASAWSPACRRCRSWSSAAPRCSSACACPTPTRSPRPRRR